MFGLPITWQAALIVLGLLTARAAISTARTSQGAVAWVLMLISFPLIAIPAFAIFGGVSRLQQRGKERHDDRHAPDDVTGRLSLLRRITYVPLRTGNALKILVDGPEAFPSMFEAIDAAETEVLVQFYILRDDAIGLELRDRLLAARARGVRVKVLCDMVGSLTLGLSYRRSLREAGVDLRGITGPWKPTGPIGVNFRNHRKELVIDNRVAFTGGMNIGQEYFDGAGRFPMWRDTHLRMEGPMAQQLRTLFEVDWIAVTGERLEKMPEPQAAGGDTGLVTGFGPTDDDERGSLLLCGLINMATKRLWIATPYLVPHRDILTSLTLAKLRGVDVKILIPQPPDKNLPWYAGRGYAHELIQNGIEVREFTPGFMHQKVLLIDDDIAGIGTANLDIRSLLLNYEEIALVEGQDFAAKVAEMLEADFARSDPVPYPGPWHVRAIAPVARLFAPVL